MPGTRSPKARTIADAIEACRSCLAGVSPTPWLDARLLAQFVTGLDASAVIAYGDSTLDDRRRARLFELAKRRASGEPVAYLTGKKSFCGLDLAVDPRALVPRPETEELVMACVQDLHSKTQLYLADVGTGCGAIACALAHLLPSATIVAGDCSTDALDLAAYNVSTLGFSDQVELVHSDLLSDFPAKHRFDAILANLPYVASANADELDAGVRAHEPAVALMGGSDGLDLYRRLLTQAPSRLKGDGTAYFECAPHNARQLAELCRHAFAEAAVEVLPDGAKLERIVVCRKRNRA